MNCRKSLKCYLMTLTFLTLGVTLSQNSQAYYSVMDTGDIISTGKYRVVAGPEFILTGQDGVNFSARVDAGVSDSSNIRALVGGGEVDFYAGLFYKYIPIPDYENQPAIGIMGGLTYSRIEVRNKTMDATTVQIQPIVSKKYDIDYGTITPYGSIPIGARFVDGDVEFPVHLALGTEYKPEGFNTVSFITEFGLKMNKSFSYINLGVIFEFDDTEGIKLQ